MMCEGGRLSGKYALVTGGRQGIGRAIVKRFSAEGATVMACGRGPKPPGWPEAVHWCTANVASQDEVAALESHIRATFGTLSILVNNAGVQIEKTILETTDADWDSLMGVNAKGVFLTCRALIPLMAEQGSIINIGSISASTADPGLAIYNASKAFVQGLTRSIAVDHGPAVRCNAISPGWIMTDMAESAFEMANNPEMAKRDALMRHPAGRFGRPDDVANLAVWLASDEAQFATGQCYTLDGGMTAGSPLNPNLF